MEQIKGIGAFPKCNSITLKFGHEIHQSGTIIHPCKCTSCNFVGYEYAVINSTYYTDMDGNRVK